MTTSAKKQVGLFLDGADYEALKAWADDDERSVGGQARFLIRQALDRRQALARVTGEDAEGRVWTT